MLKIIKETKDVETYVCDICSQEKEYPYAHCDICKRDFCKKHNIVQIYGFNNNSEYADITKLCSRPLVLVMICKDCLKKKGEDNFSKTILNYIKLVESSKEQLTQIRNNIFEAEKLVWAIIK